VGALMLRVEPCASTPGDTTPGDATPLSASSAAGGVGGISSKGGPPEGVVGHGVYPCSGMTQGGQQQQRQQHWWDRLLGGTHSKAPAPPTAAPQQQQGWLQRQLPRVVPPPTLQHSPSVWQRLGSFRSGSGMFRGDHLREDDTPLGRLPSTAGTSVAFLPGQGMWARMVSFRSSSSRRQAAAVAGGADAGPPGPSRTRQQQPQQQQRLCAGLCIPLPPGEPSVLLRLQAAGLALLRHPIVNRPTAATLLALAVAAVTPVRNLFVQELQPLNWVFRSLAWLGAACAPLACIQMGEWWQGHQQHIQGAAVGGGWTGPFRVLPQPVLLQQGIRGFVCDAPRAACVPPAASAAIGAETPPPIMLYWLLKCSIRCRMWLLQAGSWCRAPAATRCVSAAGIWWLPPPLPSW
jgi:hypothetical protein